MEESEVVQKQVSPPIPVAGNAIYAFVAVGSSAIIALEMFGAGHLLPVLLFVGLVALTLILRLWLVAPVLFVVGIYLLFNDFIGLPADQFLSTSGPIFGVALLVFVIATTRFLTLSAPVLPYRLLKKKDEKKKQPKPAANRLGSRDASTFQIDELFSAFIRVLLSIGLTVWLLKGVPLESNYRTSLEVGLAASAVRTLSIGWLLLGMFVVIALMLSLISWNRQSPSEAWVYLRSVYVRWCYADMKMAAKRIHKLRKKHR